MTETIRLYPEIGVYAWRSRFGGAWRAWVLARHLDKSGRGACEIAALHKLADDLGVNRRTFARWYEQAVSLGLLTPRRSGDGWAVILSTVKTCLTLDCPRVNRKVEIPLSALMGYGWKARVFAAFEAGFRGRPISRRKQEELTGIPSCTQRRYDGQAGTRRRPGYAVSDRPSDHLAGVVEHERRPGAFVIKTGKGQSRVAWHTPHSRTHPEATPAGRGCARKVSKKIRHLQSVGCSFFMERASSVQTIARVFYADQTGKAAERAARKLSQAAEHPRELYSLTLRGPAADFWSVTPC